jgi:hypothetical protein
MAPETITLEFLDTSLNPVLLMDLGAEFLNSNQTDSSGANRPFRVAIDRKKSKAGNSFYEFSQNGVPLPDGLNTFLKLEGAVIPMGRIHASQKSKNPTREGNAEIVVGDLVYKVTAHLTEGKSPFYIRLVAHKKPNASAKNLVKARQKPRGGKLI